MDSDLETLIRADTKRVDVYDDDGTGEWYVVKKGTDTRAINRGKPIIMMSHKSAYRTGFNIGLEDGLWWCPMRVGEYEQMYGIDIEE